MTKYTKSAWNWSPPAAVLGGVILMLWLATVIWAQSSMSGVGGGGGTSAFGSQGILATAAPYNLIFDAGTTNDGVMVPFTNVLTSATAHWLTSTQCFSTAAGCRIWVVENGGGNDGKLALMGKITSVDSDTQIHVSQTSVCNTANPCGALQVRWGTGGQNPAAQAFITAISNANYSKPTCGILPSGGFIWEGSWSGSPGFSLHTRVCLKSTGHTILYPSPDFAFTPGGQISFANAIVAPDLFDYGDIEIDGASLKTTDGRTPVFQGIGAGAESMLLAEGTHYNLSCINWGSGVPNWLGIGFDNYQWSYNVRSQNCGTSFIQGTTPGNSVHLIGGAFSDSSASALSISTPADISHLFFGNFANVRGLLISGATTVNADHLTFLPSSQEQINMNATGSILNLTQSTLIGGNGKPVICAAAPSKVFVSNSTLTAQSGQKAFDTVTCGGAGVGLMFNLGGNLFPGAGSVGDTECVSAGGTCGTSHEGSVTIAAAATTVTVTTKAVTANSKFSLTENATLGTLLGVTCNTATNIGAPFVTTITGGTSFVITVPATPVTNPACLQWKILNPSM